MKIAKQIERLEKKLSSKKSQLEVREQKKFKNRLKKYRKELTDDELLNALEEVVKNKKI